MSVHPPSDPRPDHPGAHALEQASVGDPPADVATHLASCAPCRSHVEALRAASARFRAAHDADAFVARLVPAPVPERGLLLAMTRRAPWVAPLAVAAAALFWITRPAPPVDGGAAPHAGGAGTASPAPGPLRFKGDAVALAVVRERDGRQERLSTGFGVREGDALRLQLTVTARAAVAAGVLDDDGTWIPLLTATELEAGARFVDDAVRVDAHPSGGTFVAGTPEDVERARRTRSFEGTSTLRFEPEPR